MPQHPTRTTPLVDVLGEIDIAGLPATVTWPGLGDAVGIDFTGSTVRYGVVVALDTDPRLMVEPEHAGLIDLEGRLLVLERVGALWYRSGFRAHTAGGRSS
ncbi:hypothetical protein LO763_25910 [Glycomyces sp. A-F 0318]|uniref:hypothetical protein n=1 Tax=Glycomyces amatae TaxID=2881355 RepID=UPI001E2EBA91|nr:hypothetical protein [Glycomyces amatae]MCD0447058.1 hypothetical protein [Glycomyces amatae]